MFAHVNEIGGVVRIDVFSTIEQVQAESHDNPWHEEAEQDSVDRLEFRRIEDAAVAEKDRALDQAQCRRFEELKGEGKLSSTYVSACQDKIRRKSLNGCVARTFAPTSNLASAIGFP